jgi:calcium-dependent protein kinase
VAKGQFGFTANIWNKISTHAKDLISSMLVVKPSRRISLRNALEHPWFKQTLQPTPVKVPVAVLNALKMHRKGNKLFREALKVIVGTLSFDEIGDLTDIFRSLDTERTGFITAASMHEGLGQAGLTLTQGEILSNC